MFLSMYLLYRFARSGKSWTYLVEIGLFVVLISLVSVFVPVTQFVFFMFPLSFLSFPFYFWVGELAAPVWLSPEIRGVSPWLYYHSVRFLTFDLNLTPEWEVSGGQLVLHSDLNYGNALVIAFSILLLFNVLGGVIGYLVGRRFELSVLSEERWVIVGLACIVFAFVSGVVVGAAFPLVNWPVVGLVLTIVVGLGIVLVEMAFLELLMGLAERGRVASLMALGGLVLVLVGSWFGQLVTVIGGWALVVLGCVVYFAKSTVDFVRVQEAEANREVEPEAKSEADSEG